MLLILFLSLYYFFIKKNPVKALCTYILLVCNAFKLIPSSFLSFGIKWNDACLIYLFITSIYLFKKHRNYFSLSGDNVAKAIFYIIAYMSILLLATWIFIDQDMFSAIKVYRLYLLYAIYFQFRLLTFPEKVKIYKFVMFFIIFTAILFVQQAVTGYSILVGGADEVSMPGELVRYRNTSLFIEFGLFTLLFTGFIKKYSIVYVCILGSALILPMSRTIIFVFIAITIIYSAFFYKERKKMAKYLIPLAIGFIAVWPYFAQRLSEENTLEDIKITTSLKGSQNFEGGGNFAFRVAIFLERMEYLIKEKELIFGAGLVHEDSKYTQQTFNFRYGANRKVNGEDYMQQIATNDTSWTTLFMISGLMGILLHLNLVYRMIKRYKNSLKYNQLFVVPLLSLILCLFTSITDYRLALYYYYTLFFLFASTNMKYKNQ